MMSIEQINELNDKAHNNAVRDEIVPYTVVASDLNDWAEGNFPVPFPYIGDYVPDGYEEEGETLFVDTSGFGAPDEPALTRWQLLDELKVGTAYALTSVGQFQAYVQPFKVLLSDDYKVEVHTSGDPVDSWAGNGITHETAEAAEEAARDLFMRWTAVVYWRVVDSSGDVQATNKPVEELLA